MAELTDVIVETEQCTAEFYIVVSRGYNVTAKGKISGKSTFVALHDDPYPRANAFVDQFCSKIS